MVSTADMHPPDGDLPSKHGAHDDNGQHGVASKRQRVSNERIGNEAPPLLHTVQRGIEQMTARKAAIDIQLSEMRAEGLRVLDTLRLDFTEKMDRIKEEFDNYQEVQKDSWLEISDEARVAEQKLGQVSGLVAQLNAATAFKM